MLCSLLEVQQCVPLIIKILHTDLTNYWEICLCGAECVPVIGTWCEMLWNTHTHTQHGMSSVSRIGWGKHIWSCAFLCEDVPPLLVCALESWIGHMQLGTSMILKQIYLFYTVRMVLLASTKFSIFRTHRIWRVLDWDILGIICTTHFLNTTDQQEKCYLIQRLLVDLGRI